MQAIQGILVKLSNRPAGFYHKVLLYQCLALTGIFITIWLTRSNGPLLLCYAFISVWFQWKGFQQFNLLPYPENNRLLAAALVITGVALSGGAFLETVPRFMWAMSWFAAFYVLLYRRKRSLSWNLMRYLYTGTAYLLIMGGSGIHDLNMRFIPLQWLPLWLLPAIIPVALLTTKWWLRLILVLGFSIITGLILYPWYIAAVSGRKMDAIEIAAMREPLLNAGGLRLRPDTAWKGKVVALEFWHSRCGACFRAFPAWEQFYQRHKNDKRVIIASMNVPLRSDSARQSAAMLHMYRFQQYRLQTLASAAAWRVEEYPTVLLIDQQGRLRYKGLPQFSGPVYPLDAMIEELLSME